MKAGDDLAQLLAGAAPARGGRSPGGVGGPLRRKAQSVQRGLEAGLVPQKVEDRINAEGGHVGIALLVRQLEVVQGFLAPPRPRVKGSDLPGGGVPRFEPLDE